MSGLRTERRGDEVWWTLDRPDVRNALDDALIAALRDEATALASDASVRAVVLTGAGASFCAGADLAWMRRMREHDEQRNLDDALAVAELFHALASLPMPLVARVHGAALGGGSGLLAVSDLVIAADDTQIGFTEARVGILPATIAPYVIRRLGVAARTHAVPAGAPHARPRGVASGSGRRASARPATSTHSCERASTNSPSAPGRHTGPPRRSWRSSRRCRPRPSDG